MHPLPVRIEPALFDHHRADAARLRAEAMDLAFSSLRRAATGLLRRPVPQAGPLLRFAWR